MKVMILAAGCGKRLHPLTKKIPKPLITVANKPLIAHLLIKLANVGLKDIVINVSYQAEQIMDALGDGNNYGIHIKYSFEQTALETGGGICKALPLLGHNPFIVISSDIWTDYPIKKLSRHSLGSALAHLVLVDNPNFYTEGDFRLLPNKLLNLHSSPKFTFANIGIYHPNLFVSYEAQYRPLSVILHKAIKEKKITGEHYKGSWFNVGTLDEITRLNNFLK